MIYASHLLRPYQGESPYLERIQGGGRELRLATCPTCGRRLGYVYRDIDQQESATLLNDDPAPIQAALLDLLEQLTVTTFALDVRSSHHVLPRQVLPAFDILVFLVAIRRSQQIAAALRFRRRKYDRSAAPPHDEADSAGRAKC